MAMGRNAFPTFIAAADGIIRRTFQPAEIVAEIEPLLQRLVRDRSWLEEKYRQPLPHKPYAQYLLYRPPDHGFSIVSFVWNPGQGSPVHDHCTWGVIGQYEGEEEETRYRRVDDRSREDFAALQPASVASVRPGDASHVYPPERDVHRIWNHSAMPTVSIHIYGGDIGSQLRHVYDLGAGRIHRFVSGYDPVSETSDT